ncbi:MAG: hydrogenase expression/formation protein HypE, partial [Gammaproteobacteria bacterium]|nr:hydrogenase expression/formation protein HypE [Gammaproteobacteria bacterium]
GLASAVNEIATAAGVGIVLDEGALPLRAEVKGLCELLGLDPLYLANEGTLVLFAPADQAEAVLDAMRAAPGGAGSCIVGRVAEGPRGRVSMKTAFGGQRIVDMLVGEQLPRIC